ncbi:MAG: hypothetical protein LIP02_07805, partial [Bacteroidales bacterium]|nr:hypothetical protein [Bacteroidales bacterium]
MKKFTRHDIQHSRISLRWYHGAIREASSEIRRKVLLMLIAASRPVKFQPDRRYYLDPRDPEICFPNPRMNYYWCFDVGPYWSYEFSSRCASGQRSYRGNHTFTFKDPSYFPTPPRKVLSILNLAVIFTAKGAYAVTVTPREGITTYGFFRIILTPSHGAQQSHSNRVTLRSTAIPSPHGFRVTRSYKIPRIRSPTILGHRPHPPPPA